MLFTRLTLSELRAQVAADINAALPGVDALLRYSNLGILGDVLAALASGHYEYADWIALQSNPFTATGEYLEGWAALKGVTRKSAMSATGQVSFPAAAGASVPVGTVVNRSDGVSYATTAPANANAGTLTVPVQASKGGAGGNALVGTAMSLFAGISGVSNSGVATGAIAGGADIETDAQLRSRMLLAYATPAQGGSITDYSNWALAVAGVTRAWVKPGAKGPGTVQILFMMDGVRSQQFGFPQGTDGVSTFETRDTEAAGDQLAVANAIFATQPVTALVYAAAPVGNLLTIYVDGLAGTDAMTRAAIAVSVRSTLVAIGLPGASVPVSAIEAAIAAVPGTAGFVIQHINASEGVADHGGTGNISASPSALSSLLEIVYNP